MAQDKSLNKAITKSKDLGVKDSINLKLLRLAKGDPGMQDLIDLWLEKNQTRLYNPFLELISFDGVRDTPVEVLHVILLCIVKYLARDLVGGVPKATKKTHYSAWSWTIYISSHVTYWNSTYHRVSLTIMSTPLAVSTLPSRSN